MRNIAEATIQDRHNDLAIVMPCALTQCGVFTNRVTLLVKVPNARIVTCSIRLITVRITSDKDKGAIENNAPISSQHYSHCDFL